MRKASRPQVIASLDRQDLLPAITFIFSRAGCDAAVAQCVAAGLWLTTEREQQIIAQRVDEAAQDIPSDDLDVLGFWSWRDGLLRGLAAHHAGMLPTFKEVVEKLFVDGLVKAVFATETLALGVNMPARCVVLEKLDKFNGEAHVNITAGEYTQLTGRAGRRGIDVEGHAVVLWQPGTDPGGRRRPRLTADLPAELQLPAHVQHVASTSWRSSAGPVPGRSSNRPLPSSRRTVPWSGWPGRSGAGRNPSPGSARP